MKIIFNIFEYVVNRTTSALWSTSGLQRQTWMDSLLSILQEYKFNTIKLEDLNGLCVEGTRNDREYQVLCTKHDLCIYIIVWILTIMSPFISQLSANICLLVNTNKKVTKCIWLATRNNIIDNDFGFDINLADIFRSISSHLLHSRGTKRF